MGAMSVGSIAIGTLLSGLAGCGGGSSQTAPTVVPTPTPAGPSFADVSRFLAQATLGFTRADLNALKQSKSYSGWIDAQFAAPASQGHYDWLVAKGYNAASYINSASGLDDTIWRKFISGADPLRQRMVLTLSEICVISVLI